MSGARSLVIGTAGHIDHGKTRLVRALTGVETDRHPEEKRRGITIELGFAAWRPTEDLELSIVDVPGHESFVRTMIAGAGGIDLVLLVISAEDGVMPQTREHLAICRLLGIRSGVVALTKVDLLDEEELELAVEDVRETLAGGPFADAAIFPCSATEGEGLDALREGIVQCLRALPARDRKARVRLPIDRAFTMKGHGTVLTGTLLSGTLASTASGSGEDETAQTLRLVRRGRRPPLELRLRGLQVRGQSVDEARAGSRVAANLAPLNLDQVGRGDVLCAEDAVIASDAIHIMVDHLETAAAPLTSGTSVQLCAGTAHATAHLDPLALALEGEPLRDRDDLAIRPGQRGLVRLRLDEPLPTWWGQRVVLRAFHSKQAKQQGLTVAGGRVVDPAPSRGRKQRPRWVRVADALRGSDPVERARALLEDAGDASLPRAELRARAGLDALGPALGPLRAGAAPFVVELSDGAYAPLERLDELRRALRRQVDAHHDAQPLTGGIASAELVAQLPARVAPSLAQAAIEAELRDGGLELDPKRGLLARPGRGHLDPEALPPTLARIVALYRRGGETPPTLKAVADHLGLPLKSISDPVARLQSAGLLVRVSAELSYDPETHDALLERCRAALLEHGRLDVQGLKALSGLSRKFAVPFLEHLDRLGITRRRGDERVPGPKA